MPSVNYRPWEQIQWMGLCVALIASAALHAQGTILLCNKVPGLYAPITSYWDGSLLPAGDQYTVELWVGRAADSLAPVLQTHLTSPGVFGEGLPPVSVPWVPPAFPAFYQVVAWDNQGGTVNDKQTAEAKWLLGSSGVYGLLALGDIDGDTAEPILADLQSFAVPYLVPEPGMWVLVFTGLVEIVGLHKRRMCR